MKLERIEEAELVIVHDYQEAPGACMPGEEIVAIILIYRRRRYWIPLGPTHMVFLDYLARCRYPEDAQRIAGQIRIDAFAQYHASNSPGTCIRPVRTSRSAVRQQVHRILEALTSVILGERLDLDPRSLLRAAKTSSGTVGYFVGCPVIWEHFPQGDRHWDADLEVPDTRHNVCDHADGVRLSL